MPRKFYGMKLSGDGRGYECSSAGDRRFSAFYARLEDGRTIEQHYQCDVKGYEPGGTNWRLGKGKPPINRPTGTQKAFDAMWKDYLDLWRRWAKMHPELMGELRILAEENFGVLTDRFANTPINQARALAELLNEGEGSCHGS